MADVVELQERMVRMLECPICFSQFLLPKVLPCQHTFCKACLEGLLEPSAPKIKCPNCRRLHKIPKDGVNGFPPNVTMSELIDVQQAATQLGENDVEEKDDVETHEEQDVDGQMVEQFEHLSNTARYLLGISEGSNESVIIEQRGEAIKDQVTHAFDRYQEILNDRQKVMTEKVDAIVTADLKNRQTWKEDVRTKLERTKELTKSKSAITPSETSEIKQEINQLSKDMMKLATSMPQSTNYHFTYGSQTLKTHITDYGNIILERLEEGPTEHPTRHCLTRDMTPLAVDYYPSRIPLYITKETENVAFSAFGIAVSPNSNIIATDIENHHVHIFSDHLEHLTKFGKLGEGNGELNRPTGVAVDTDGSIFVADQLNNRLQVFRSDGEYESQFGGQGSNPGQFIYPSGIAINKENLVFVCDGGNFRIQVVERNGTPVFTFGSRTLFTKQPMHLAVTLNGTVLVTDEHQYIRGFVNGQETFKLYLNQPMGIAADKFGNMVVGDSAGRLVVLKETGESVCHIGTSGKSPGQLIKPRGLALTRSGTVIVADVIVQRIQVFDVTIIHDVKEVDK